MFTISGTPASRANGSPSCQASSQTVIPHGWPPTSTVVTSVPGSK